MRLWSDRFKPHKKFLDILREREIMNNLTEINKQSNELVEKAKSHEVSNQFQYDSASGFLKGAIALKKQIESFFESSIKQFKKAKAEAEAGRKAEVIKMEKYCEPVEIAIDIVKKQCKEFENAEELKRIESQRIADEEAEKKAEAERIRLEKKAELAKDWGDEETAEELEEESKEVEIEPEEVKPTIAKTSGIGIRRVWKWKIIDETKIPREYLRINEISINKTVRELKDETAIAGIEVYYD